MTQQREHLEQVALFDWAKLQAPAHPELRLLFAIPNGGERPKSAATALKREGVRPGVPDVCLPVPKGPFSSLYIELKAPKEPGSTKRAGRLSPEQTEWGRLLLEAGCAWEVCFGWDEARGVLARYLGQAGPVNSEGTT